MFWFTWTPVFIYFFVVAEAKCPAMLPLKIGDRCFSFVTDFYNFDGANQNCMNLHSGATFTTYKTEEVLRRLESVVADYVAQNMKNAIFWIGLKMDDLSMPARYEDREWTWLYDDSTFVQKQYSLWSEAGGPSERGQDCAIINGTDGFLVSGLDCDGPRFSTVCMMDKNKVCKSDDVLYMQHGDYCLAFVEGSFQGKNVSDACSPEKGTPYTEDMKEFVVKAIKNSILGGGIYMYIRRNDYQFYDLTDLTTPDESMWEEKEPRSEYDCAGLSLQADNTLKLKTMNCAFPATSLCSVEDDGPGKSKNFLRKLIAKETQPYQFYVS